MLNSQLAQLCCCFIAQCSRPGLVKWSSQAFFRLRSAKRSCLSFILLALTICTSFVQAQEPVLQVNTGLSTDGYYVLSWDNPSITEGDTPNFVLTESRQESYSSSEVVYSGPDKSRVFSGKPDGLYYYWIADSADPAQYSEVVTVEVRHHSLQRALFFFTLGLIVFGSILVTVFLGMKTQKEAKN